VTYTLGCSQGIGEKESGQGIKFTATFRQSTNYISSPFESKLKFRQIVNTFSKERSLGASDFQCQTERPYASDTTNGWKLDTTDPYTNAIEDPESLKSFDLAAEDGTLTITTSDSPGVELDVPGVGTLDYFYTDRQFEMYVVYYVEDRPSAEHVLAKLPWSFGGEVVRDNSLNPPYRQNFTLTTSGPIQGASSVNAQRLYYGNVKYLEYGNCPGEQPPPPPDPCLSAPSYKRREPPVCE
jgi:hypothetical protein